MSLFSKSKKTGWADDPDDLGGQTMVGVTMATYEEYCRRKVIQNLRPEG